MNAMDFLYLVAVVVGMISLAVDTYNGRILQTTKQIHEDRQPPINFQEFYRLSLVLMAVIAIIPLLNVVMAVLQLRYRINTFVERKTPQ